MPTSVTLTPYIEEPGDYTAGFPAAVVAVPELRDFDINAGTDYDFTLGGTVPASGSRKMRIPIAPLKNFGYTITVGGVARTKTRLGAELTGQVGIDEQTGLVSFHSSDAGGTIGGSMRAKGSALFAGDIISLFAELRATQTELKKCERPIASATGVNLNAASDTVALIGSAVDAKYTITRVLIEATTVTDLTSEPTLLIGTNEDGKSDAVEMEASLIGCLALDATYEGPPAGGRRHKIASGARCQITISTAAVATALVAKVTFFGIPAV